MRRRGGFTLGGGKIRNDRRLAVGYEPCAREIRRYGIVAGKLELGHRSALYCGSAESRGICQKRVGVYRRKRIARAEGRKDAPGVNSAARYERRFEKLGILIHAHRAHSASEVCRVYKNLRIAAQERASEIFRRRADLGKIRPVEYEIGKLRILRSCKRAFCLDHCVGKHRRQAEILSSAKLRFKTSGLTLPEALIRSVLSRPSASVFITIFALW